MTQTHDKTLNTRQKALKLNLDKSVYGSFAEIGAGQDVDAQVLVTHDMLGITPEFKPRFLRTYANLQETMLNAFQQYIKDVKSGSFPNEKESY